MRYFILLLASALIAGCATRQLRQADLDAWIDVPVVALDTHSRFLTLPMVRTMTDTGVEIRVYSNKQGISRCVNNAQGNVNAQRGSTIAYANFNTYQNCSSQIVGCDAIVYIRDGKVLQVKGVGLCYSDERSRPEPGYERFMKK